MTSEFFVRSLCTCRVDVFYHHQRLRWELIIWSMLCWWKYVYICVYMTHNWKCVFIHWTAFDPRAELMFREIKQLFYIMPWKAEWEGQGSSWKLDWEDWLWSFVGQWGPEMWCSSILPLWQSKMSAVISDGGRDFVLVGHLLGRIFALERLKSWYPSKSGY